MNENDKAGSMLVSLKALGEERNKAAEKRGERFINASVGGMLGSVLFLAGYAAPESLPSLRVALFVGGSLMNVWALFNILGYFEYDGRVVAYDAVPDMKVDSIEDFSI